MIRIELRKVGTTTPLDVTDFLQDEAEITLNLEREVVAFERQYSDTAITLSDLRDTITDFLDGEIGQTDLHVFIYIDGVRRFAGYIDQESLELNPLTRWADFDTFDLNRVLMERAKEIKLHNFWKDGRQHIWPLPWTYGSIQTLKTVLEWEIAHTEINSDLLFSGLDLGDYATRQIDPLLLSDLDADTTWYDLLNGLSLVFNAEFYIDPEDLVLKMKRRRVVLNDRQVDIVPLLKEGGTKQKFISQDRIDYIYTTMPYTFPGVTLVSLEPQDNPEFNPDFFGLRGGTHTYVWTTVINGGEAFVSKRTDIDVPSGQWRVTVRIPKAMPGTETRHLYRLDPYDTQGLFRRVATVEGEEAVDVLDPAFTSIIGNFLDLLPIGIPNIASCWIRYNEDTATWDDPIVEGMNNDEAPKGKILDVLPSLKARYHDSGLERAVDQKYIATMLPDAFDFSQAIVREGWQDMFRTRRGLVADVMGIDFMIGDSIVAPGVAWNDLTVDQRLVLTKVNLMLKAEEATIEAVTL